MRVRGMTEDDGFGPYTILDLNDLPEDGKGFELEDGWLVEVAAGIPQYWIVEHSPDPKVQILTLGESGYVPGASAASGARLTADVQADKPFSVSFDPASLLAF